MKLNMTVLLVFSLFFINGCLVVIHAAIPIISEPTVAKILYRKENVNVNLQCQASSHQGSVHYEWLRNGKSVIPKTNTRTGQQISYSRLNGSLIIIKFNEDYNGDYNCVASSKDASSMSQTQTLIQVKYSDFDHQKPKNYQRDEYTYLKIPCDKHGEIVSESMVYLWYTVYNKRQIEKDGGRRFIDKKGNLHFTFLNKDKDEQADKGYECGHYGKLSNAIRLGSVITLTVTNKVEKDIKPVLEYNSTDNTGQLGSEVKLECLFSGYDTKTTDHLPTIKWFDDQIEIKNNNKFKLSTDNHILTIKNLEEKDEKYYFCQGYTTNGPTPKKAVHLNVTSQPIWVEKPKSINKPIGDYAVFNCNARSSIGEIDPTPPVWYINAKKVQNYGDYQQYTFSDDKKKLTVRVKTLNDTKCFQCMVTNSIGKLMGEACLKAVLPIVISVQPPDEQHIQRGEIVNLTVLATVGNQSNNTLTCQWTYAHNMDIIPFKYFVESDDISGTTFINTSKLCQTDYEKIGGVYTCRITYGYSKIITTKVVLKDLVPAPASSFPWFGPQKWIVPFFVFIIGIVSIIVIISLKQKKGDYNVDKKETGAGLDPEKKLQEKGFNDLSKGDDEDSD